MARAFFMGDHDRADSTTRVIRALRLALSGAVVGAAIAGLFSRGFGGATEHVTAWGAGLGFIVVAAIKCAHLI
jgi:hypothetical protein